MLRSGVPFSVIMVASSLGCFVAVPALAQSNQGSGAATASQSNKALSGSLVKTHGDWRSSKLVGATVYDDNGKSVGTIDDLLVSSGGSVSNAILSVGGFLGIGTKLVEVPFNKLKFAPSASNPASDSKVTSANSSALAPGAGARTNAPGRVAAVPGPVVGGSPTLANNRNGAGLNTSSPAVLPRAHRSPEFSVVLPGATEASLKSDPEFKFSD